MWFKFWFQRWYFRPSFFFTFDSGTLTDLEVTSTSTSDVSTVSAVHPPEPDHPRTTSVPPMATSTNPDCLDPRNHQHLPVLYISYSPKSVHFPYPCTPLWLFDWNYYEDCYRDFNQDRTLGYFLDYYAFRYNDGVVFQNLHLPDNSSWWRGTRPS